MKGVEGTGLAGRLFGSAEHRRVPDWADQKVALVDNSDLANEFAANINLPGITVLHYAHRILRTRHRNLLGGIRFYANNIERSEPVRMSSSLACVAAPETLPVAVSAACRQARSSGRQSAWKRHDESAAHSELIERLS